MAEVIGEKKRYPKYQKKHISVLITSTTKEKGDSYNFLSRKGGQLQLNRVAEQLVGTVLRGRHSWKERNIISLKDCVFLLSF